MSIDNGVYIDLSVEGDARNAPLFEVFKKIREADLLRGPLPLLKEIVPRIVIISSDVVEVTYESLIKSFRAGDVVGIVGESVDGAVERLTSALKSGYVGFVHLFGVPQIGKVLISGASDYVEMFSDVVDDQSSVLFVGEVFGRSCEVGRSLTEYLTIAHLLSRHGTESAGSSAGSYVVLPEVDKLRDSIFSLIRTGVDVSESGDRLIEDIEHYLGEVIEQV